MRLITCWLCDGVLGRACRCHNGGNQTCDMVCNPKYEGPLLRIRTNVTNGRDTSPEDTKWLLQRIDNNNRRGLSSVTRVLYELYEDSVLSKLYARLTLSSSTLPERYKSSPSAVSASQPDHANETD